MMKKYIQLVFNLLLILMIFFLLRCDLCSCTDEMDYYKDKYGKPSYKNKGHYEETWVYNNNPSEGYTTLITFYWSDKAEDCCDVDIFVSGYDTKNEIPDSIMQILYERENNKSHGIVNP